MKKKYIIPASSSIALSAESALLETSITVNDNNAEGNEALTNRQGIGGGLWENCKK